MEDDIRDLIDQLYTQAGAEMEDASVTARTIGRCGSDEMKRALAGLADSAEKIAAVIEAAQVLVD